MFDFVSAYIYGCICITVYNRMSSLTIWTQSFLSNKALKCTSLFRWLMRPKSIYLYCWFRRCRLARSRHGVRLLNIINHLFAARSQVKSIRSELRWRLKWDRTSPLRRDGSFFRTYITPTTYQALLGTSVLLKIILSYSFCFYFSTHYTLTSKAAKIYDALLLNRIKPEIEKIL